MNRRRRTARAFSAGGAAARACGIAGIAVAAALALGDEPFRAWGHASAAGVAVGVGMGGLLLADLMSGLAGRFDSAVRRM